MSATILLATGDGLVSLDGDGATLAHDLAGRSVSSVAAADGRVHVALGQGGVHRRGPDGWELLGLEGAEVWVVAAGPGGVVYAGLEPAALWRLGDGPPVELSGLDAVEGHESWHSPWGPADLPTIVVDGPRLVVGVEVGGVAMSHDGGATWEARNEGLYEDVHHVVADGPRLWATTGMGCYASADEGRSWTWASEGLDRGYTQGLALAGGSRVVVSAASGPPPMWEEGGPEAALFAAEASPGGDGATPRFEIVAEGFAGNVERQGLAASGDLVVAGTGAGELLVSRDGARTFERVRSDLPPVTAVALA